MKLSGWRFCVLTGVAGAVALFLSGGEPHAQSTNVPSAPGKRNRVIIYPSANETVEQLKKQGITKVDSYGSYWVAEASEQQLNVLKKSHGTRAVKANHLNRIELAAAPLDTTVGELAVPSELREADETGNRLRLIQFKGPVQPEWLEQVKAVGDVKVAGYVPNNAYILYLDDLAERKLNALKEPVGPIQWIGSYHPYYKLADGVKQSSAAAVEARISVLHCSGTKDAIMAIGSFAFNGIQTRELGRDRTTLTITTRPGDLPQIARLPEVLWIELVVPSRPMDEKVNLIVAGFTNGVGHGPSFGDSYLNFLSAKGFSLNPAQYPVVDVADTGLDAPHPDCDLGGGQAARNTFHPSFYEGSFGVAEAACCIAVLNTRVVYNTAGTDTDGHGTRVASILAGFDIGTNELVDCYTRGTTNITASLCNGTTLAVNPDCSDCADFGQPDFECITNNSFALCVVVTNQPDDDFPAFVRRQDGNSFQLGLGISPFGRIGASTRPTADFSGAIADTYLQKARISNNSWGDGLVIGGNDGVYNAVAQTYDSLVRDALGTGLTNTPNESPLNQEIIIVFSAGSNGQGNGQDIVGGFGDVLVTPPGTAKNVISVGATENLRPARGDRPEESDNAQDISRFSAIGPTRDGRFKPEIVAPGDHVTAATSQGSYTHFECAGCNPGFPVPPVCSNPNEATEEVVQVITDLYGTPEQVFQINIGSSYAAPAVSGGAQLLWWWFQNRFFMLQPSPAMTKAYILNSAQYLSITNPLTGTLDTLPSPAQGMGRLDLARMFDLLPRVLRDQSTPRAIDTPLITTNPVPQQTFFSRPGQSYQISGQVFDSAQPFRVTLSWVDAPGDTAAFKALVNDLDLEVSIGGQTYRGNQFVGRNSVTGCPNPNRPCPDDINNTESVFLPAGVSGVWTATVRAVNIPAAGVPNVRTGLGEDADLGQDFALVVYNSTTNAFGIAGAPTDAPNPATNDTCQTAITITNFPFAFTNTLTAANYSDVHPSPSAARGGREEFFKIPRPAVGTVFTVISSGGNSLLSVWRGDCGGLVEVGSSASVPTAMDFTATGVGDYYLVFDGLNGGNATVAFTVTNTLPAVAVFPSSIDFGDQATSTTSTPPQSVTIVNSGGVPLQIQSVLLTGANPSDFLIASNPCIGATIQASDSCSFDVRFRPTVVGTRAASLVIITSDPNTPTNTVTLTGNGVAPAPAVSMDSVRFFGNQVINSTSSPPQAIIVSNSGASTLVISNVVISGGDAGDFILSNTCAAVPPGGICTAFVRFRPTATGVRTSTLFVFSNADSSPDTVDLNGNGIAPGIGLNTTSLTFGTQAVSVATAPLTVTVLSIGDASLRITNVALIGTNAGDFAVTANTCAGLAIPPGSSCGINITFTPSALGNRTAQLVISGEATNSPRVVNLSGVGASTAPSIGFDVTQLGFGNQPVGTTSTVLSVTVTNTGNAALAITNAVFSGGNAGDFTVTNNLCLGLPIPPGGSCTIGAVFHPSATGARASTLQVFSNSGVNPATLPVSGNGVAPGMVLSPSLLNFNTQAVSIASAPLTVNVLSVGDSVLTITNVTLLGTNAAAFSVSNGCAGAVVPPGSSCGLTVIFTPVVLGTNTAILQVWGTATNSPQIVNLRGIGANTAPSVGVTPSQLVFGNQSLNTTSTILSVTVSNTGNATLAITNAVFSGGNAGDFTVTNNLCGSIPPGGTCTIGAVFHPSVLGARASTLQIFNNSGVNPVSVPVSGNGTAPEMELSPTSLNFGTQAVSVVSAPQTVIVQSSGDSPLTITNVTIIGTNAADFAVTNNTCLGVPLPPGDSCGINFNFRPSALGTRTAQAQIWGDATNSPQIVNLSGIGGTNVPSIAVTPVSLIFGDQAVGTTSAVQTVTVNNSGSAALIVSSVSLTGPNAGDFILTNNTCTGIPIPAGGSCTIGVASAPTNSGLLSATLRILSNAGNGTNDVPISSSGGAPAITLSPNPLDFGSNVVGSASTRTLTVLNSGDANLVITGVTIGGVNSGDFSNVLVACTNGPVLPGQSCFIGVQFRPTAALPRSAQLIITSNATNSPAIATLTGVGVLFSCPTITISPSTLPDPVRGVPYSQTVSASGGISPYSFQITAGTLPTGLALSSTNGLSATISGTPTASGIFNFTLTAIDSNNCTGSQSYTLTVACPTITVLPQTLPAGSSGVAYSQNLLATGGAAPYTFGVTSGSLPPGLSLASNGALTGTPTANGSFTFTVTATDSTGCTGSRAYTIDINCPNLTVLPSLFPSAVVNQPYAQTNSAIGGTPPYTFALSSGTLPSGLSYSTNGVLAGTPTEVGTFNFTILVSDANGCTATRAYSLSVICGTLTLLPQTLPDVSLGQLYTQAVFVSGRTGGVTFARTQGSLPPGITLSGAGTISGTATALGTFTFQVTATEVDTGCTGNRFYTIKVLCPTITLLPSTLPMGGVGTPYSVPLTASNGAAPYIFTQTSGSLPAGMSLSSAGTLSGTPISGSSIFEVTATDTNGCKGTRTYTLILSNNCPPITVTPGSLPDAAAGAAYSQTLSASGGVEPYAFSVFDGALPPGIDLSTVGVLSGAPTATGTATFTVAAIGGDGCAGLQSYTINVTCSTITVLPSTLATGIVGAAYSQTLLATGGVAPHSFAVTGGTLPAGLTLESSGALTGTPTSAGTFAFTAGATDAASCVGSGAYSVTINPSADLAISKTDSPDPVNIGSNVTYTIIITNFGPSTATSVTVTDTLPASVTFVSASSGCAQSNGVIVCGLGALASGSSVTITSVVTAGSAGNLTNTATVTSSVQDLVLTNNTATATTVVSPLVAFGGVMQIVNAKAGTATLNVNRLGSADSVVTVDYATSDETAIAGADYVATSGVLSFDPGVRRRTVIVPLLSGSAAGHKTLRVGLNNPTGGASLGERSVTTVDVITSAKAAPVVFTDVDGDIVTIKLGGAGLLEVSLVGANGPVDQIGLTGTDGKSTLTVTVKRGGAGNGLVDIGSIISDGSLKGINAKSANIVGDGIQLEGSLGTLNVKSINGSSVYAKTGIGTINVVELSDALVAAGFVPTDDGNPFAAGAFTPTVLIKSIKASNFANSAIAAAQIGKAQLGNVNTSNGGKLFGIWAHESLGSVKMGKKKLDSSELNGLAVDDFRVKRQ